jgi:hypothetical protein
MSSDAWANGHNMTVNQTCCYPVLQTKGPAQPDKTTKLALRNTMRHLVRKTHLCMAMVCRQMIQPPETACWRKQ